MKILPIELSGSIQNPAWISDKVISFTRWRSGYNQGNADVGIYDIDTGDTKLIVTGGTNVSQPGSCYNAVRDALVISSDKGGEDWPCIFDLKLHTLTSLPRRPNKMGYEPSWSPDGSKIVYEEHYLNQETHGMIIITDGTTFKTVTVGGDCRQPNWSLNGQMIAWQEKLEGDEWGIRIYRTQDAGLAPITVHGTDITFGPNSEVVYSDDDGAIRTYTRVLFKQDGRYAGAPSWNGKQLIFETCEGDPDGGKGTRIAVKDT